MSNFLTKQWKKNSGLLDKRRFIIQNKEHKIWLENLTFSEAIKLEEKLISSNFILEWKNNFADDNPVCIKFSFRKKT